MSMTIQMNNIEQYFRTVFTLYKVVLTFESVDEIPMCYHSNGSCWTVLWHCLQVTLPKVLPTFESVDEILTCFGFLNLNGKGEINMKYLTHQLFEFIFVGVRRGSPITAPF